MVLKPWPFRVPATVTTRSGAATPAGARKSSALAIVRIPVVAPTPIAIDTTATAAKSGVRRSPRSASRTSVATDSGHPAPRAARASAASMVALPNSRRAATRASAGASPRAMYRSVARSTCARISSSISRCRRPNRNTARRRSSSCRMKDMAQALLRMAAMAPEKRSHVARCSASCFRPSAVSE